MKSTLHLVSIKESYDWQTCGPRIPGGSNCNLEMLDFEERMKPEYV